MLFYELIQIALGLRNSLSYSPSEQEWETMFETAQKQAVAGIVFCKQSIFTVLRVN